MWTTVSLKEPPGRKAHSFRDERGHGVADEAVSLGAGLWEAKPIGEALDAHGLARCQGAVLGRVDEH